jgi:hypothetical protein
MAQARVALPQVSLVPEEGGFAIRVAGVVVRRCLDELDAHHWAKHAIECVNRGMWNPRVVREQLESTCLRATMLNAHV